jgi:proteasome lid subunit RPN8/RPN11
MQLTREQLGQLIALARADAPRETCGIIGGKEGRALRVYPIANVDPEPRIRYNCEPQGLLNALRDIDENGWDHLAIYHSHPATPAYPSQTDISRAFYPDAVYLLISLMNPEQSEMRAFRIVEGKVGEVTLEVEDEKNEPSRTNSRRGAPRAGRPRAGRAVAALSKRRPAPGGTRRARR